MGKRASRRAVDRAVDRAADMVDVESQNAVLALCGKLPEWMARFKPIQPGLRWSTFK